MRDKGTGARGTYDVGALQALTTAGGRDVRVAFVGDPLRFLPWAMSAPAGGLLPRFVAPHDRAQLAAFRPDVVVVLDVDAVDPAVYADLGATVLAIAVSDTSAADAPPATPLRRALPAPRDVRPKLERRLLALARRLLGTVRRRAPIALLEAPEQRVTAALEWREQQHREPEPPSKPYDRLVALDPRAARGRDLWRLIPPPVDDRLFAPVRRPDGKPRVLIAQPSTTHREKLLTAAKHAHDVRHIAHGITPDNLPALLRDTDAAIVVAPDEERSFDHAVALHLAAGHLVITNALTPAHGIEAGIDALLAETDTAISYAVGAALAAPGVHHATRVRGRLKAERFRASAVWPALIGDLVADVDAFG